jgi:hypothetical protein
MGKISNGWYLNISVKYTPTNHMRSFGIQRNSDHNARNWHHKDGDNRDPEPFMPIASLWIEIEKAKGGRRISDKPSRYGVKTMGNKESNLANRKNKSQD